MPIIYGSELGEAAYTPVKVDAWEIIVFACASIFLILAAIKIFTSILQAKAIFPKDIDNRNENSTWIPKKIGEFEIVVGIAIPFYAVLLSIWGVNLIEKYNSSTEHYSKANQEQLEAPTVSFEGAYQINSLQSVPSYPPLSERIDFDAAFDAKTKEIKERADNLEKRMIQSQIQDLQLENQRLQSEMNYLKTEQSLSKQYDSNPNN